MKIKNIFRIMILFVAALFIHSCSDEDNVNRATGLDVTLDEAEVSSIAFPVTASYRLICIHTDGTWNVSIPDADTTWLHVTPHEGYGRGIYKSVSDSLNTYVRISVDKNEGETKSSTITVTAGSYSKTISVVQAGSALTDSHESSFEFVANAKLGYNLGNTLDSDPGNADWFVSKLAACTTSADSIAAYETSWGQPVTTQKMIDDIHAAGFNVIRVPVTWGPHLDANNKISKAWMDRVEEIVKYVIKDSCYCIINVMHDTGTDGWCYADVDDYSAITLKYQTIWKQIAERFKDYDNHLIFESFNEILNKKYSWTAPDAGDGAYTAINKLQQDFVNTVRATGGNNLYRNLGITTYAATANADAPVNALSVPNDVVSGHIYATFHSYDPYNFCNNNSEKNADGTYKYDYNIKVWGSSCEATVDDVFKRVGQMCNALGIPYIYGEFGAIDENKNMNERVKYATYLAGKFKEYKTTGLWWMGLYDRKTNKWYEDELVKALFK